MNICEYDNCNKKLNIFSIKCRCGKTFCKKHEFPYVNYSNYTNLLDGHMCKYDYKTEARKMIMEKNPIIKSDKIIKI
jgi:hypothetical protein